MIFLEKPVAPPKILTEKSQLWTNDLLEEVRKYGEYKSIPKNIKESLVAHYRHDDIKEILFKISNEKCAFCESKPGESGNIEVEHFAPKSEYPELTFDWNNLLPVCRKCNGSKGTLDTKNERIVNPCLEDPEEYFVFDNLFMIPKDNNVDIEVAARTIKEVELNSPRLFQARADLLANLCSYIKILEDWIDELGTVKSLKIRHNKIIKLENSLELIDNLTCKNQKYSAFTKNFIKNNKIYLSAKKIVEEELY